MKKSLSIAFSLLLLTTACATQEPLSMAPSNAVQFSQSSAEAPPADEQRLSTDEQKLEADEMQAAAADPKKNLPNFAQVNPFLYRGGLPTEAGVKELATMGVKTVINLHFTPWTSKKEEAWVKAAGMNYVHLPMGLLSAPSAGKVSRYFEIINSANQRPVYVHCLQGRDRTGVMVALYRIQQENWTANQAYEEMKKLGFHRILFPLKNFVYQYATDMGRTGVQPKLIQQPIGG